MSWVLAPNVAEINADVRAHGEFTDLGTIGDTSHQRGAGDHTPWSTHVGKYGYPDQGQVHAQDIGASEFYLDLLETFVRRSWRRGELAGVKYINVLNRHWNVQTWASFELAKSGQLRSVYSGDHHFHVSMENGSVDGDLVERFFVWLNNGQRFVDELDEVDEMGVFGGVVATGDAATVFGVPEATEDRWVKLSFAADFGSSKLRVALHVANYWDVKEVDVSDSGNRIYEGLDLPRGTDKVSVTRLDGKETPVGYLVEFK
jgi:hypothetical protein